MEPFFFGRSTHLFGVFHPCLAASVRGALVIAPPLLNENIRSHFAMREVAVGLSRAGYDVLRFDFSGCGDSHGNLADIRVEDWMEDLRDAARELKEITGTTSLSLYSARFSACLAAVVSADVSWDKMVMWDPVLQGSDWIERIKTVRSQLQNSQLIGAHEYLGELASSGFTESVNACNAGSISAQRIVAIVTDEQISVNPEWECHKLSYDSQWEESFTENLFSHQVIEKTINIFSL